ncbi:MAG: sensor hybrid histidine kinase [Deferribacteraceae bacterium]|nr:sensor hybrid histidine kinase [Deferribacteraceae bacterium]
MCSNEALKKYKIIFETSGIPIYTVSKDERLLEANQALAEIMQTDLENLIGKPVENFYLNKDDRKKFLEDLQKYKKLRNYRLKFKTLKNKIITVLANVQLWDDENSEIMHHGVLIDITDVLNLHEKVSAIENLETNNKLLKNFIKDLKDGFTERLGLVDLLLIDYPDNEKLYRLESGIEKSLNQINRFESLFPDENVLVSDIELNSFIIEHKKLFDELIPDNITISVTTTSSDLNIKGDYTRVLQIFTGIIQNAAEAIEKKGIEKGKINITLSKIDLTNHPYLPDGKYAEIVISDNGIGIKEENINKIFSPDFSTKSNKGLGLGLTAIFSTLKEYKGDITVNSKEGEGAEFTIYLPLSDKSAENTDINESEFLNEISNSITIFFVDDDDFIRSGVSANLEREGFNVIQSDSPRDALSKLEEYFPLIDIMILDVKMAGMSGGKLYETIKEKFGQIPAIFISGYSDDEEILRLKQNFTFLKKPFTTKDLVREIHKVINAGDEWMKL